MLLSQSIIIDINKVNRNLIDGTGKKMKDRIEKRNRDFRTVTIVYLIILFFGLILSFLASYYVQNGYSNLVFKVFMIPVAILYIVICFLQLLFLIEYSNKKFSEVPKWWIAFYISVFIPYVQYFVPLVLFLVFCARGINIKKLIFLGFINFIPFILNEPIRTFVYEILKNHISDKVLLFDLYIFFKETVFWICRIILINLIASTSIESSSMDETIKLDDPEK